MIFRNDIPGQGWGTAVGDDDKAHFSIDGIIADEDRVKHSFSSCHPSKFF